MKKLFLIVLMIAANTFAQSYRVDTEVLTFANETAAKGDTLATGDSAFSVIYLDNGGDMPNTVTINLPGILASGDSAKVYVRQLSTFAAGKTAKLGTNTSSSNRGPTEGARAANSTGTNVYASKLLGTYYYNAATLGACSYTWSPKDSIQGPRVEFVLVETAGAPIVTGMRALLTSLVSVTKVYQK